MADDDKGADATRDARERLDASTMTDEEALRAARDSERARLRLRAAEHYMTMCKALHACAGALSDEMRRLTGEGVFRLHYNATFCAATYRMIDTMLDWAAGFRRDAGTTFGQETPDNQVAAVLAGYEAEEHDR